jgi:hypothetical protein
MKQGPSNRIAVIGIALAACGGITSPLDGSDGGTSPGLSACEISDGTYDEHFVLLTGDGGSCEDIPDQRLVFHGNQILTGDGGGTSGVVGDGCQAELNASACKVSQECVSNVGALGIHFTETLTFHGNAASGEATITVMDGQLVSNCSYDITLQKL